MLLIKHTQKVSLTSGFILGSTYSILGIKMHHSKTYQFMTFFGNEISSITGKDVLYLTSLLCPYVSAIFCQNEPIIVVPLSVSETTAERVQHLPRD